ncbi:sigma-70 family RNA polymerase sigma factor [Planctomycetales bacterium ZRK34]|nr:sigma-70 family RNA polymerase sigma factor [Planctomycetales bacterium ZRK34]
MQPNDSEHFVTQLTAAQTAIYAYIMSLLPDRAAAEDLLQETNLTLWRKADTFEPGTNFVAWACQIAQYKVMTHRRTMARDRHVFSEQTIQRLTQRLDADTTPANAQRDALLACLNKLSTQQRDMLRQRYEPDGSVQRIARQLDRPVGSISQTLYRIRAMLADCITKTLVQGGKSS